MSNTATKVDDAPLWNRERYIMSMASAGLLERHDGDAIREFSNTVGFMMDREAKEEISSLIQNLMTELKGESRKPTVHPLIYANLAFILGLVFACGSLWARVAYIEAKAQNIDAIAVIASKVDNLSDELGRMRQQLNDFVRTSKR